MHKRDQRVHFPRQVSMAWNRCVAPACLALSCLFASSLVWGDCPSAGSQIVTPLPIAAKSGNSTNGSQTPAPEDALGKVLAQAQTELNQCKYLVAEATLRGALESATLKKGERDQLQAALERAQVPLRQERDLDEIARLASEGRDSDISSRLQHLMSAAADSNIRSRVARQLDDGWGFWSQYQSWARKVVLYLGAGIAVVLILIVSRAFLASVLCYRRKRYRYVDVNDSSGKNVEGFVATHFEYWREQVRGNPTSGLSMMEASSVPKAPSFKLTTENHDIAREFDSIEFKIGGTSVNVLVRSVTTFWRWWFPQATEIQGLAYVDDDKRLCARLSVRLAKHCFAKSSRSNILTVSATAEGTGEDAVRSVTKEVTFKMLYAIAKGSAAPADVANDLRLGLDELRAYLAASETPLPMLERSRATFERVRKTDPEFLEAHLYEGIALDLLERHDEAAAHFAYVKALTQSSTIDERKKLHEQAQYNEAVAHLRNLYGLESIETAITFLGTLLGPDPKLRERPILALATATLADAWANKTVQWKDIAKKRSKAADGTTLGEILAEHEHEVFPLVVRVQKVLAEVDAEIGKGGTHAAQEALKGWNPDTRRQVEWGVHNAKADYYLYAAVQLVRFNLPYRDILDKAIAELEQCEMLLPAGVETLTNAGTAFMTRGQDGDLRKARSYLQRAIALNVNYEYAYYRLAQTWEKEQWREKVIVTLKSFPGFPQIPQFHAMFNQYFVSPKVS
jgi:tetratricopeptide (TPR) repeat protein